MFKKQMTLDEMIEHIDEELSNLDPDTIVKLVIDPHIPDVEARRHTREK